MIIGLQPNGLYSTFELVPDDNPIIRCNLSRSTAILSKIEHEVKRQVLINREREYSWNMSAINTHQSPEEIEATKQDVEGIEDRELKERLIKLIETL